MSYLFNGNGNLSGTFSTGVSPPCTLFAWFKYTDHPEASQTILSIGASTGTYFDSARVWTFSTADQFYVQCWSTSGGNASDCFYTGGAGQWDSTWTPICGVYTSDSNRRIYIGSTSNTDQGTQTADFTTDGWDEFSIGESCNGGNDWNGYIAHAAVWDSALSSTDVDSLFAGAVPNTIATSTNQGYWPMSVDQSNHADESAQGNGPTLTITGTPAYNSDDPLGPVITDFGDEAHTWGESGLVITGTNFGS